MSELRESEAAMKYEAYEYQWALVPIRYWLGRWFWRRREWHFTRFRGRDGQYCGTWQLGLGPLHVTRVGKI